MKAEVEKAKEFYSNSDTANVYEIMVGFARQEVEKALKENAELEKTMLFNGYKAGLIDTNYHDLVGLEEVVKMSNDFCELIHPSYVEIRNEKKRIEEATIERVSKRKVRQAPSKTT